MAREAKPGLSDTGLQRLLRRIVPDSRADAKDTHRQLMEESERRLAVAAASGDAAEKLVATRILGCPHEFQRWEEEHGLMMQRVTDQRGAEAQKAALLSAALALIHRKALFEYVRDEHVCGGDRQRLLAHFHGGNDYAGSFIQEHANYLRSAASYLCVCYLGQQVMHEPAFDEPLARYEEVYAEYFGLFCEVTLVGEKDEAANHSRSLLIPLKQQVNELRGEILGTAAARSGTWRKLSAGAP
ncbi:MAG: hypothetical protein ACT4O5_08380 [Gammaproteobacteria bacterium]